MARLYARLVGPTVILIGVVGLVLGNRPIGGALNIDLVEDAIHLSTGGLLTGLGFARVDDRIVRTAVGGLGVVYLAVGIVSFLVPDLFGSFPTSTAGSTTQFTWLWECLASVQPLRPSGRSGGLRREVESLFVKPEFGRRNAGWRD